MTKKDKSIKPTDQPELWETLSDEQKENIIQILARLIRKQVTSQAEKDAEEHNNDTYVPRQQDPDPSS
jgi:predicted Fe-S protein YdhL (DUF1289 family)